MNNKLSPVYNAYQYLVIFFVAIALDLVVHFFSTRKFTAMKNGTDAFGFAPHLAYYYNSLSKKGPLPFDGSVDSFYSKVNSWTVGAIIAGSIAIFILLITDLVLHAIDYRNKRVAGN